MRVNFNYLPSEFKNPEKIILEWRKLIKTTDFTLGRYIEKFEKKFRELIGSKYCISTNNGTDALILCLKSIGIKDGDEVITACNSFMPLPAQLLPVVQNQYLSIVMIDIK